MIKKTEINGNREMNFGHPVPMIEKLNWKSNWNKNINFGYPVSMIKADSNNNTDFKFGNPVSMIKAQSIGERYEIWLPCPHDKKLRVMGIKIWNW